MQEQIIEQNIEVKSKPKRDVKEYNKQYYIKNRQAQLDKVHNYYKKNSEKVKQYKKDFYQKNKEKILVKAKESYELKKNLIKNTKIIIEF